MKRVTGLKLVLGYSMMSIPGALLLYYLLSLITTNDIAVSIAVASWFGQITVLCCAAISSMISEARGEY